MQVGREIIQRISSYLPRLGLSSFIVCLLSGGILLFIYRPMGDVFRNVEEITTLVPFGWFFRQLHYSSGQVFVILMLLHTVDHFLKKRYRCYPFAAWSTLLLCLGLCFFTLFTGFILKGDQEGIFAGLIFVNILKSIPLVGEQIARLFMDSGESFFFLPYLYHCFFLPVLIAYLLREHIHAWLPDRKTLFITSTGLCVYALTVRPHLDVPPGTSAETVEGPWFFLGIQTLLRVMPPVWAGLAIPFLFLGILLILPLAGPNSHMPTSTNNARGVLEKGLHYLVIVSFCSYCVLTIKAMFLGS